MELTADGFEYKFTPWEVTDKWALCRCVIYFEGTEICNVPCTLSKKEWNNGNPDPDLIAQLMKNGIESANDLALMKLGWPPYDKDHSKLKLQSMRKLVL